MNAISASCRATLIEAETSLVRNFNNAVALNNARFQRHSAYIQDMKIKMKSISTHKKQTDYTK